MTALRRVLYILVLALVIVTLRPAIPAHADADAQIVIKDFAFSPASLKVAAGTTVTWINRDDEPHTVVSAEAKFRSDALDTGDKFTFTFTSPGTYSYFCTLHPHMTGLVEVTGGSTTY